MNKDKNILLAKKYQLKSQIEDLQKEYKTICYQIHMINMESISQSSLQALKENRVKANAVNKERREIKKRAEAIAKEEMAKSKNKANDTQTGKTTGAKEQGK